MIRTFVLGLAAAAPIALTALASATPAAAYEYGYGYKKSCHYEYRQVRVSDGYGGYKYVTQRVQVCH